MQYLKPAVPRCTTNSHKSWYLYILTILILSIFSIIFLYNPQSLPPSPSSGPQLSSSWWLSSESPQSQSTWTPSNRPKGRSIKYSTVVGFFAQDLTSTDDSKFDYISSNFGLLDEFQLEAKVLDDKDFESDKKKPNWKKFEESIKTLNKKAPKNTQYKVLFLARHGQGYHNAAESYYTTHLWNCYWSLLDGNGTTRWDDAKLTESGIAEAKAANGAWKEQAKYGVPFPDIYYSSPLSRAASTLQITWEDITLNSKRTPKPIIKEKLRETMGIHTCDRRAPKCEIARAFPNFTFEPNFADGLDPFWDPVHREPDDGKNQRLKAALDEIFFTDVGASSTYISITAHSGAITSILEVIGHRKFRLQTGGMIPAVIKVEYLKDEQPPTTTGPSGVAPRCTIDPTPAPAPA